MIENPQGIYLCVPLLCLANLSCKTRVKIPLTALMLFQHLLLLSKMLRHAFSNKLGRNHPRKQEEASVANTKKIRLFYASRQLLLFLYLESFMSSKAN